MVCSDVIAVNENHTSSSAVPVHPGNDSVAFSVVASV